MQTQVQKIVIVGGGTAGWMTAAMLKKILANAVNIELVESEAIGIIGVGEATIPPIRLFNNVLGINEAEFIKATKASIKLAIKFENWRTEGESYFHTFGAPGKSMAFCPFHHFWLKEQAINKKDIWQYDLNYLCAINGQFDKLKTQNPFYDIPYAYHFDAALYGQFLRSYAEAWGVKRTEGIIDNVIQNSESGYIESVQLQSGDIISGDLFIDCSGAKGLLIHQTLNTGYEDWSHWLPCDRAVAVASERFSKSALYTRSIAHYAGWQWQIPLQHRNGNGLVYSSRHISDEQAVDLLLNNLGSDSLSEPKLVKFRTGRTRKQWNRNVIAIGLSSGFLEPLESTSIYLIQSAIVRLLNLFPNQGIDNRQRNEYNQQSEIEYSHIRDFIILHYIQNERNNNKFWHEMQQVELPERLQHKMELFKKQGVLVQEQYDIFLDSSWLQVMVGQGITPQSYHPLANNIKQQELSSMLENIRLSKLKPLEQMPSHDNFLNTLMQSI
ncbi:tryptophan 7-halogenase [Catenovulum sp. 2E275]|uniref:tryptophan halogenase family protein n=1 Tax=Catenovulum sp. 2E275 TaxID=2980497 RepID=UPI0021D2EE49|nr:tryptophan halogenase family protein [Catenovulum sp. 2E275]MCU4675493.1 tryptophan 7-halogenase [Catenovulum sp. 2E275]